MFAPTKLGLRGKIILFLCVLACLWGLYFGVSTAYAGIVKVLTEPIEVMKKGFAETKKVIKENLQSITGTYTDFRTKVNPFMGKQAYTPYILLALCVTSFMQLFLNFYIIIYKK